MLLGLFRAEEGSLSVRANSSFLLASGGVAPLEEGRGLRWGVVGAIRVGAADHTFSRQFVNSGEEFLKRANVLIHDHADRTGQLSALCLLLRR